LLKLDKEDFHHKKSGRHHGDVRGPEC
jgi:hypothetical protein